MIFRRFSVKTLIAICAIIIMCFVIMGVIFYSFGSQMVIGQAKNEAMRIARRAARDVDGDIFAAIKVKESASFKEVYDALSEYKTNETLGFIYSMKKVGEDEIVFVVDTDEDEPADIFEPYEWLDDMAPAFAGEVCSDQEFNTDEWGTFLSGYAPIFDSEYEIVGIVGCDISRETINERLNVLRNLVIMLMIFNNIVVFIMFGLNDPGVKSRGG